jgi:CheY-like chemotaxis protein
LAPAGERPLLSESAPWDHTEPRAQSAGQKKPLVFLIEDNVGDVLLVEEALREYRIDCDLTVVADGEEAIRFFQTLDHNPEITPPSLVLLDLNLPKRSGHEVLEVIRRSTRCPAMSVVVVTSSQHQSDLARMRRLGATAYFHKPSNFDEFMKLGALIKDLL